MIKYSACTWFITNSTRGLPGQIFLVLESSIVLFVALLEAAPHHEQNEGDDDDQGPRPPQGGDTVRAGCLDVYIQLCNFVSYWISRNLHTQESWESEALRLS